LAILGLFVEGGAEDGNGEMAEVDGAFVKLKPADDTVFAEVFGEKRGLGGRATIGVSSPASRVNSTAFRKSRSTLSATICAPGRTVQAIAWQSFRAGGMAKPVRETFEGDFKLNFNLAPPLLAKKDAEGRLLKGEYGPWVFTAFKLLKKLKFLRGGRFDLFGHTDERRMERQLIVDYRATIEELLGRK